MPNPPIVPAAQDLTGVDLDALLGREWLAVNGIGGFACSTVPGTNTRKYHGLLVAAMAPPVRRMVLLSRVEETVVCDGWRQPLACNEYPGAIHPRGDQYLRAFSPDPYPRWAYQADGWTLEKSVRLVPGRNAVVVSYTLLGGRDARDVELQLRPMFALRGIHDLTYQWAGRLTVEDYVTTTGRAARGHRIPPTGRTPEVFFAHDGVLEEDPHWYLNTIYRREQQRGYAGLEDLWNPGVVHWSLKPGQTVHFACSTDPIDLPETASSADVAAAEPDADPTRGMLTRAAGQFVLNVPSADGRRRELVAADYPWSPPSPRLSLIGFAGLFLVPGRLGEARAFLLGLAGQLNNGLLPSALDEAGGRATYHAVDVSLWFVNAVHQFDRAGGEDDGRLLDAVLSVLHWYREGTTLGIGVDVVDGLLSTNQPGVATTWMDVVADGWVVTPRGGKAVEVNALWYNALRSAAELAGRRGRGDVVAELTAAADKARSGFNRRFWNEAGRCCYDVVDAAGADPAVRPNQLLAISLPFPVLAEPKFEVVLETVRAKLLTPFGPRTLATDDPHYCGHYAGNVADRDRAYHQGSVFPWLLGPYVSAYLRVHGRGEGARREAAALLEPCLAHVRTAGQGQLCELFDGDAPHRPGGAIASAAAVAEMLRAYAQDVLNEPPAATDRRRGRPADSVRDSV